MENNAFSEVHRRNSTRFLHFIIACQFAMWGTILLDRLGFHIPIIRQLVGFVYLTFIPGTVIIRILKLHNSTTVELILYSVGLSLSFMYCVGFLMNTLLPPIGFSKPLSEEYVILIISTLMILLCIICYFLNRDMEVSNYIDLKQMLSPLSLFFYLIPLISIFGTYWVYYKSDNIILMLLIVLIALSVSFITLDISFNEAYYPLAIFSFAIALVYHRSLISPYLLGSDIVSEYSVANLVITKSYWDLSIPFILNSLASVTILPAIYSIVLKMDIIWIYKIIYPFILSLVPLGLYVVFKKQTNSKNAFLASFFFTSFHTFFITLTFMARQQIAEFFFVLFILILTNKNIKSSIRSLLLIIFGFSLVMSHYGLSYIFTFYLVAVYAISRVTKMDRRTTTNYVAILFVFVVTWYIYSSHGINFDMIIQIIDHIHTSIYTDFFSLDARDPMANKIMGNQFTSSSLWRQIGYITYMVTQFCIIAGMIKVTISSKKFQYYSEYMLYSLASILLLFLTIVLPFFATNISSSRLYHVTLFFLSPFFIVGAELIYIFILNLLRINPSSMVNRIKYSFILIILIPYFLFSTGFIFEVVGDTPSSGSLGLDRMKQSDNPDVIAMFNNFNYVWDQDIDSVRWLYAKKNATGRIYADTANGNRANFGVFRLYDFMNSTIDFTRINMSENNDYIYFGHMNIIDGLALKDVGGSFETYETNYILESISGFSLIYSNGGSIIYKGVD